MTYQVTFTILNDYIQGLERTIPVDLAIYGLFCSIAGLRDSQLKNAMPNRSVAFLQGGAVLTLTTNEGESRIFCIPSARLLVELGPKFLLEYEGYLKSGLLYSYAEFQQELARCVQMWCQNVQILPAHVEYSSAQIGELQ